MAVTQMVAQDGNGPGQYFIGDRHTVPDVIDQFIALNDLVLLLSKVDQDLHDLGLKVKLAVISFQ